MNQKVGWSLPGFPVERRICFRLFLECSVRCRCFSLRVTMTDRLGFLGFHRLLKQIRPSPRAIISHHTHHCHHCHHCGAAGCWAGIPHSTPPDTRWRKLALSCDRGWQNINVCCCQSFRLKKASITWRVGANQPRQSQYLLHLGFQSDQLTFPPRDIGNGCELFLKLNSISFSFKYFNWQKVSH